MSDLSVIVRVREALILFGLKVANARESRSEDWLPSEAEAHALLMDACVEAGVSEAHLAEALEHFPELAEAYGRALEVTTRR